MKLFGPPKNNGSRCGLSFLYCSNSRGCVPDRQVAEVADLFEARDHAKGVARSLIATASLRDWRSFLRVNDELGDEIFAMRFSSVLGRPYRQAARLDPGF